MVGIPPNVVLARRCTKAGRTQTAVGAELGTTPQRIGVYERGVMTANAKTVIRHLAVLGYQLAIVPIDTQEQP